MAKSNSGVAARRREHWRELLRQWRASGLSQARFCREQRVPVWKFAWWKKRLGVASVSHSPSFVPVQVVPSAQASALELTLPGGRVLRFGADVDATRLAEIVAALAAAGLGGSAC